MGCKGNMTLRCLYRGDRMAELYSYPGSTLCNRVALTPAEKVHRDILTKTGNTAVSNGKRGKQTPSKLVLRARAGCGCD